MVERKVFTEGTSIDEIENFIKERPDSNFIVNCTVGSEMMKKSSFNVSDTSSSTHHLIYKVGEAHGKNIYVWAMMAAKDMSVYSVDDKFIEKFDKTPAEFIQYCGINPNDYETIDELSAAVKSKTGFEIKVNADPNTLKDLKNMFEADIKVMLKNALVNEVLHTILLHEMSQYVTD